MVTDVSGHDHHGTLTPGPLAAGTWVSSGKIDGALDFRAGTDSVSLPASAFTGLDDEMTLSMWLYGDASLPEGGVTFSMYNSDDVRVSLMRVGSPIGNDAYNYWQVGQTGSASKLLLEEVEASKYKEQWNHYIYTKNAVTGMMDIYINGVFWRDIVNDYSSMGVTEAYLGSSKGIQVFKGMIDNVRLYNVEMNATTAAGLYNLELSHPPVADDQTLSVAKNGHKAITLTSSSATAFYTVSQSPAHGVLTRGSS